jgi:16S rRNA G966 N2-methylase RsmD
MKYYLYKENNNNNIMNKIFFPKLENEEEYNNLQIDHIGKYSITFPKIADLITDIIYNLVKSNNIIITDCTAGVGGNVISFANKFKYVNAIEISKERYDMLQNNINIYKLSNISTFNSNALDIIFTFKQDIIYIDPPWGGRDYKEKKNLRLYLGNIGIEKLTNMFLNNKICNYIILKLPTNYDLNYLRNNIEEDKRILINKLNKMLLIIIYCFNL